MSVSLAKKSLMFIESANTNTKTKKSKIKKSKDNFKKNQKRESSVADNHTEQIVKTLLAYNDTNFDEKIAKKVVNNNRRKYIYDHHLTYYFYFFNVVIYRF